MTSINRVVSVISIEKVRLHSLSKIIVTSSSKSTQHLSLPRWVSCLPTANISKTSFNCNVTSRTLIGRQQLCIQNLRQFNLDESRKHFFHSSASLDAANQNQMQLNNCRTVDDVLKIGVEHIDNLSPNQIAAVWSFLSRLLIKRQYHTRHQNETAGQFGETIQHDLLIVTVLEHTMTVLEHTKTINPKDLTTIIHSLAKIVQNVRAKKGKRLNAYQKYFRNALLDGLSPRERIFKPLAKAADNILQECNSRNLSNLAYAHALLRYDPKFDDESTLLENIAKQSIACIQRFNSHDISNMVWAYATMNTSSPQLFHCIGDTIADMPDLYEFKPQALSNTVWAYATLNVQHPRLFKKVGDAIVEKNDLTLFKPQEISNIVWAYATSNSQHSDLFIKVASAVMLDKDLRLFAPQALSNIVWAYANANVDHPDLFEKVGNAVVQRDDLQFFTPQALSNLVWAYARAKMHHRSLFRVIGDTIVKKGDLKSFKPQSFSNIVWAFATVNEQHTELFEKVGATIAEQRNLPLFNTQNMATIAWAYAASNVDVPSFNDDLKRILLDRSIEFNVEDMVQLYQWHLWQTGEKYNEGLPTFFEDKCRGAFLSMDFTSSSLQKDVLMELDSMGLKPVEEYLTPSGYSLDALIEINGTQIGVEVDGPYHFIGKTLDGSTLLKQRQILSIDKLPLVSLPYWEWNELGTDRDRKQQYLRSLLESFLV